MWWSEESFVSFDALDSSKAYPTRLEQEGKRHVLLCRADCFQGMAYAATPPTIYENTPL